MVEKFGIQSISCYGQLVCPTILLLFTSLIIGTQFGGGHYTMNQIRCLGTASGREQPGHQEYLKRNPFPYLAWNFREKWNLVLRREILKTFLDSYD